MTKEELLERQHSLVSYLADPRAFGESDDRPLRLGISQGIDPSRLETVGLLAQGKRITKVMRILPRTFSYLQTDFKMLAREFACRHPPRSAESFVNACQFYVFLRRAWRDRAPDPPFLPDLAYCELALVSSMQTAAEQTRPVLGSFSPTQVGALRIRRRPGVHLRRCEYNIQPLFDSRRQGAPNIVRQPTWVILSCPLNVGEGRAFGVAEDLFELVGGLKSWRTIGPADGLLDAPSALNLFRRLEELGILEIQPCASA